MKDLFQLKNFESHGFKLVYLLKILKFVFGPDLCPEHMLVYLIAHLISPADMSNTELLLVSPKSLPPKASASQLMEMPSFYPFTSKTLKSSLTLQSYTHYLGC